MNTAFGKVIDAIFGTLDMFKFWFVLNEFQRGIVLRLGKKHRDVGRGLNFKIPFKVESVMSVNIRKQTSSSWDMTHTTSSGQAMTLSCAMVYRVKDPSHVLLRLDDWKSVTTTIAKITVTNHLRISTADEILSHDFTDTIKTLINAKLEPEGVEVIEFGFDDLVKTRAYKFFKGASN